MFFPWCDQLRCSPWLETEMFNLTLSGIHSWMRWHIGTCFIRCVCGPDSSPAFVFKYPLAPAALRLFGYHGPRNCCLCGIHCLDRGWVRGSQVVWWVWRPESKEVALEPHPSQSYCCDPQAPCSAAGGYIVTWHPSRTEDPPEASWKWVPSFSCHVRAELHGTMGSDQQEHGRFGGGGQVDCEQGWRLHLAALFRPLPHGFRRGLDSGVAVPTLIVDLDWKRVGATFAFDL